MRLREPEVDRRKRACVQEPPVEGPGHGAISDFWKELQAEHTQALQDHGLEAIKRQQALRYFTWRWSWRNLRRSEQFRFLLSHARPLELMKAFATRSDLTDASWAGVPWSRADRRLYCAATRLIWQYAERATSGHSALRLAEPLLGSPLPVFHGGRLISQDLANSALELSAMERGGVEAPRHVLEIGAGYGRTAYAVLSLFEDCHYTIVDIEPALTISKWYLRQLFDPGRLSFLSAEEVDAVPPGSVDLAISISTLSEMTPETRDDYLAFLDQVTAGGRVYLKQWKNWHNPVDDLDVNFDDFAIPARWVPLMREPSPVQTHFVQALWRNPG
jgi:putative sugar O-methyltransferase